MSDFIAQLVTVAVAIVGLAIVAVLVSKQAQTGSLIQNATVGLANDIGAAVSPLSSNGFASSGSLQYATNY
jgi:PRD1 phage membrane DNA delivery